MDDYLDFFEITRLVCCLIVAQSFMEFQGGVAYKVLLKKACILHVFVKPEAVAQRCSVKKGVLRNFKTFTGKHLCQSLFFNKGTG